MRDILDLIKEYFPAIAMMVFWTLLTALLLLYFD